MKIQPLRDNVLVKLDPRTNLKTAGGILLADTCDEFRTDEKLIEGTVIAVGEGQLTGEGEFVPLEVTPGDKVLVEKYGGTKVKTDGEEYKLFKEREIYSVVIREGQISGED